MGMYSILRLFWRDMKASMIDVYPNPMGKGCCIFLLMLRLSGLK